MDEFDDIEDEFGIYLTLDNETRMWEISGKGPAAMLLYFLTDGEHSVTAKLAEEAKFDKVVYGL